MMVGWLLMPNFQTWFDKILDVLYPPYCASCQAAGTWFCDSCLSRIRIEKDTDCPESIDACLSLVPYANREMRILVTRLKYQSASCLIPAIRSVLRKEPLSLPAVTITWVPASRKRLVERGIDHAHLIAAELAEINKVECIALLERNRHTQANAQFEQHDLRKANVSDAFSPLGPVSESVLLVDDVKTSGATASACARVLKQAGAKQVILFTLAYGG